jgi:hypothetical protein
MPRITIIITTTTVGIPRRATNPGVVDDLGFYVHTPLSPQLLQRMHAKAC